MGNFFRSVSDLKAEIDADRDGFLEILVRALDVAGRSDLHDDVKDAVVALSECRDETEILDVGEVLLDLLQQGIGTEERLRRTTP